MNTPLTEIGVQQKKASQFERAGIRSVEDLLRFFPKKYIDYSHITPLNSSVPDGFHGAYRLTVQKFEQAYSSKTNLPFVKILAFDAATNVPVSIIFFNQRINYPAFAFLQKGVQCFVAGPVSRLSDEMFSMSSPQVFDLFSDDCLRLYPVYRKIKGMSDAYLTTCIDKALATPAAKAEPYPTAPGKETLAQAYYDIHHPATTDAIDRAYTRFTFDILLKFCVQLHHASQYMSKGSPFNLKDTLMVHQCTSILPYDLTEDQKTTLNSIFDSMKDGRRVNALVQGDVGSGKTIIAFLTMIAMVGSGYQCAMMAPSKVLAQQHYNSLLPFAEKLGIETALVVGNGDKKTKNAIASGKTQIVIGTHSLISSTVSFKNLALVVVDEEHKFGVTQRESILKKAAGGVHCISMSATPIPRSLAQIVYGNEVTLHTIKTMPKGRVPVKTASTSSMVKAMEAVKRQLDKGHQAFVVCPMISASEKMAGVKSVDDLTLEYSKYFNPLGYTVVSLTGKDKKADLEQKLQQFEEGNAQIMIATTVVEVGVNIPNATIMVIHNAERFGLSSLHQLRGRVGRSSFPSYCALVSTVGGANERLKIIETSNDGFAIAAADLQLRGPGEWLGDAQSGRSSLPAQLMIAYPTIYQSAKKAATYLIDHYRTCDFVENAIIETEEQ